MGVGIVVSKWYGFIIVVWYRFSGNEGGLEEFIKNVFLEGGMFRIFYVIICFIGCEWVS